MSTLYRNGKVLTMDTAQGTVDAFLVEGDRFTAVGDEAIARGEGAEVVDLGGATVVPGLIDGHAHLETGSVSDHCWVDMREVGHEEALSRLAAKVATVPPGEWVIGQGVIGQSIPGRKELDSISPVNPVVIRGSMHMQTANTIAFERAGLLDRKYEPAGVLVPRHPGGDPTGVILEGYHLFPIPAPPVPELSRMLETTIRDSFNRYGVTTVYEVPFTRNGMSAFQLLERSGRLTARMGLHPAVRPGLQPLVDDIEQWASIGLGSGFGNDMLWLGGAKFFLDGSGGASYTISRDPEHPAQWGAPTHTFAELVRALLIGYEAGIQFWIHALGPDAENLALDAVTEAQRLHGGDSGLRTRIEHIGNERVSPELLDRIRAANVIPVPNAVFLHLDMVEGLMAYRTLIDNGFMPPGNSDNAGTQPFATNPWFAIGKMRTRLNKAGVELHGEERTTVYEGIRTYTEFAAYAGHREGRLGVIRPKALADFAVLSADPLAIADEEIEELESVLTVVGGTTVWDTR